MVIKTKFNLGEEVFILSDNRIFKTKIKRIDTESYIKNSDGSEVTEFRYEVMKNKKESDYFSEEYLFKDIEEVTFFLTENLIK